MDVLQQISHSIANIGHTGPFLALAILILAGMGGGMLAGLLRLPRVTGNILGGFIIGPACLGVIGSPEQIHSLEPLSTFAMSLVAVSIGGHLSYRRIHNSLRRILTISLFEVTCSVAVVVVAARLFRLDWGTAGLLGALCVSTAPATTIVLIREMRARGPFVKTLVSSVALNNILCILLFVMVKTCVASYFKSGETTRNIDHALFLALYHFAGAVVLGSLAGWVAKILVAKPRFHDFSTIMLTIMLLDGLADFFALSPLLVSLFLGVYLANSSAVAEKQLTTLEPLEPLLYVCFFTLAGASLHLDAMVAVGGAAVVYVVARVVGKSVGSVLGGIVHGGSGRIWRSMAISLYPQSGIAIGLVVLLGHETAIPESIRQGVSAIILAGVTVSEIIGPFCTKAGLIRSGEAGRDRQRLVEFLAEEFIVVGLEPADKWDAIRQLVAFLMRTHRVEHITEAELVESVIEREEEMSTAIGGGIAIPHGRIPKGPAIQGVMGICRQGIDFDALDGEPVRLIMLVCTPEDKQDLHLKVLGSLSAMVQDESIRTRLLAAISAEDAMEVIESKEVRDYNYFLE